MVEKDKDIQKAMKFLNECELLKIEDVLPFFPDFVTIDHFKVSDPQVSTSIHEHYLYGSFINGNLCMYCDSYVILALVGCHLYITSTVQSTHRKPEGRNGGIHGKC